MANVLDYDIVISEFQLYSRYNVHFQANTREKGMDPLFPYIYDKV